MPPAPPLATRRFTTADQDWFAAVTGDANPLHVDPLAARRGLFGAAVVHGMHATAWSLERFLAAGGAGGKPITGLSATFARPIFVDEPVELSVSGSGDAPASGGSPVPPTVAAGGGPVRLTVAAGGGPVIDVRVDATEADADPAGPDTNPAGPAVGDASPIAPEATEVPAVAGGDACRVLSLDDLEGREGAMTAHGDPQALEAAFPHLASRLGSGTLAGLLGLSTLVGMECPGRDGLFSAFDVRFDGGTGGGAGPLRYAVERVDRRFSLVRMRVGGSGLAGSVTAFLRPPPERQQTMAEVAAGVEPGACAGQRALVVGGSRGLGEVTAKLVAAGGGEAVVTYRAGRDDAVRVVDEIRAWGGTGEAVELDVADPARALEALAARGWTPTHVYYYATPRIFVRKARLFDPGVFRQFAAVYVDGFVAVHEACRSVTDGPLRLFYPSTVAVDEDVRELTEYAAAKAAGESLCRSLDRFAPRTRVVVERLPRIATDQTATLLPVPAADAVTVLRGIVTRLAEP